MMSQTFGDFRSDLPENREFLILGFSPTSIPIQHRWRNNGLSADFVADYLTTFFPCGDDDLWGQERQAEIKGAVSYIANELLENAMKFSDETTRYPINFGLHLIEEDHVFTVVLLASNSVAINTLENFKSFVHQFLISDTEELYIQQLEKSAEEENSNASGLGLLTMKNDYAAKLGWKIETVCQDPEIIAVTTMAQLTV